MIDDDADDALTPAEREALARLRRDEPPPAALEDRIVRGLRSRNVLRATERPIRRRLAAGLLAGAAVFALGVCVGTLARRSPPATGEPRFLLLLYEDAEFEEGGPEDARARVREYSAWARSLAEAARLVAGEELADGGEELRSDGRRHPLPVAGLVDQPRGYFVITAHNEADAREIAATCPHLRHGGRVVVRPIKATR